LAALAGFDPTLIMTLGVINAGGFGLHRDGRQERKQNAHGKRGFKHGGASFFAGGSKGQSFCLHEKRELFLGQLWGQYQ
jgi:hypothetical protein